MIDPKKASRKTKKFSQKLLKERGIICTQNPTYNIAICNAGQATGLTIDNLIEQTKLSIPNIKTKPKLIAEKGLTYSFLVFESIEDAQLFYQNGHGRLLLENKGPPLYMIYVDKVPDQSNIYWTPDPSGLTVIENFITDREEDILYKIFDFQEVDLKGALKNRQVKHYGYEFRYGTNDVDLNSPLMKKLPSECDFILERLKKYGVDVPSMPDQLTVNKYLPGQGIPSHVDRHSPFGDHILSLSLGGAVVMDWKRRGEYVPVQVPGKSMLVMRGEARYDWQHGITARNWDPVLTTEERPSENNSLQRVKILNTEQTQRKTRISLTFRWTRKGDCECSYLELCDSKNKDVCLSRDEIAEELENLHVHKVYEEIASHFSTTRHKAWPRVERFVSTRGAGGVLLDLGSGNGKNILRSSRFLQIAAERSSGLLAECKSHVADIPTADCVRADLLTSPFVDACADAVICIAVIHHFSNEKRRIKAISEISRLLRRKGQALITVWARDQSKSNYLKNKQTDIEKGTHNTLGLNLPVHENGTQFEHGDLLVPWKLKNSGKGSEDTLLRYYHVFEEGELDEIVNKVDGLKVIESFYEQGNWCVIVEKN